MDEPCEVAAGLFDGRAECSEREDRRQRFRQTPADDFLRVCIRNKVQVTAPIIEFYIGDVAHPQLVGGRGNEIFDEVLPLVVAMVGVRRGADPAGFLHQMVAAQQVQKRIPSGHPSAVKHRRQHQPQFHSTNTGIDLPYLVHGIKNPALYRQFLNTIRLLLVKGLTVLP